MPCAGRSLLTLSTTMLTRGVYRSWSKQIIEYEKEQAAKAEAEKAAAPTKSAEA